MHINPDPDPYDSEWADQSASERMKAWMRSHGWSIAFSADPADVLSFIQQNGDDADFDFFNITIE